MIKILFVCHGKTRFRRNGRQTKSSIKQEDNFPFGTAFCVVFIMSERKSSKLVVIGIEIVIYRGFPR